jgi:hypothetical protein
VETVSYTDKRLLESCVQVNLQARFGEGALETQVKLCAGALLYKNPYSSTANGRAAFAPRLTVAASSANAQADQATAVGHKNSKNACKLGALL